MNPFRKCPTCNIPMREENEVDDFPSCTWICPVCGHIETDDNSEDFDPEDEITA